MLQFIAGAAVGAVTMIILFWKTQNYVVADLTKAIMRGYETIDKLQDFIDKNINERVIYSSAEAPYSTEDREEKKEDDVVDGPEPESDEVTPEELAQIAEEIAKQNEEGRK